MLLHGDSLQILKDINNESIDLIVTDPPYGIEFMGKDWDKALPSIDIWKECYRVLKEGKLAFVMCSPRQDVLSRMIISLEDAGFRTNYTSIYWTYASGFPKAANVSKLIDKRNGRPEIEYEQLAEYLKQSRIKSGLSTNDVGSWFPSVTGGITGCMRNWEYATGIPTLEQWQILKDKLNLDNRFDELIERTEAEREIIGQDKKAELKNHVYFGNLERAKETGKSIGYGTFDITKPATEEAKKMEGAYVGFQPKPAVEIILVVSKGKTLTWLDDCRIPYQSESDKEAGWHKDDYGFGYREWSQKMGYDKVKKELERGEPPNEKGRFPANLLVSDDVLNGNGAGQYSRYFSLDKWSESYPFLIVPKASKGEKNKGVSTIPIKVNDGRNTPIDNPFQRGETLRSNTHPTVKPLKLFSYLITMGSRENDLILDPFCGSGTTLIAADNLARKYIGIEINQDYLEIAKHRLLPHVNQTKLTQII